MIKATRSHGSPSRPPLNRLAISGTGIMLTALLALSAGCAPRPQGPDEPAAVEQSVKRFSDEQQEGFEIRESSEVTGEIRDDFNRAVELLSNNSYDEAIALLEKVVARSPEHTAPHINLALAYEHKEQPEKAEEQLKIALKQFPGHPVASNVYGLLLRKDGRFNEAREIFEQSLKRFPEFLSTRKNLGILYELYIGDLEAAVEHYQVYNEAMPKDEEVTVWIAGLRQRLEAGN